jgi:SAM-dependent methyltransferase
MDEAVQTDLQPLLPLLCCPGCAGPVVVRSERMMCSACAKSFEICDGIPMMFWPHESSDGDLAATTTVKDFYEETPFPNYEEFDSVATLIQKARLGWFAKLLDDQVPQGALVLECGCGTGQLSNFLSIANRRVLGTDICLNSLRLGHEFKAKNELGGVHFLQMNLFRPVLKPGVFDLVISNGVLHHTPDPARAFESIARLVKPNGYILVGLYHRYGRLITDLRRVLFRLSDRLTFLDPNLRRGDRDSGRWRAWFRDQYKHPLESKHTIGEVLKWIDRCGFTFVKSIPRSKPFQPLSGVIELFEPEAPGNRLERLAAELPMALRGSREGGFFIVIAQRTRH